MACRFHIYSLNCRYLQLICRYLQIGRFADIYNSIGDIYNSAAKVALVNKIWSLLASYLYNIMARSVQEITSFTPVSIIIIIHNVINNKVFFIYSFWLIHSLESLHSDSFGGERLFCHFYRIADIHNSIGDLQIDSIWRYLQLICRSPMQW